jgi:general stress protein 26
MPIVHPLPLAWLLHLLPRSPRPEIAMATPKDLETALWKGIEDDRTLMLGLETHDDHMRPMTGLIENGRGPIWIFTSADNGIVHSLAGGQARARACYTSKGHALFACIEGSIEVDNNPAVIERLWNPFVAAWYEGGKTDPALRLLRFDAERAHIWQNESTLMAGIHLLFGRDPKKTYADKTADVDLR